jgi:hypothetical protein
VPLVGSMAPKLHASLHRRAHGEPLECIIRYHTDDCQSQCIDLKHKSSLFFFELLTRKKRLPGSISPFIMPMTLYVSLLSRRLNDLTSTDLKKCQIECCVVSSVFLFDLRCIAKFTTIPIDNVRKRPTPLICHFLTSHCPM